MKILDKTNLKKMKPSNDFDKFEIEKWFRGNYECWLCGQNHWNCLHHIVGRGKGDSRCERSILNACPLNNFKCHLPVHAELKNEKNQAILIQKTIRYLLKNGYTFNEIDEEFIFKYKRIYDITVDN